MSNPKVIAVFCIAAIVIGGILYLIYPTPKVYHAPNEPVACTADAKLCPDGSYVGRTGPNCEFSPCPIPPGVQMEDGTLPE